MKVHYTAGYLLNPRHKVTINVAGAGGTGSQVLTSLARMNEALVALGHPGVHVRCYDGDSVTSANIGRQLFSPADEGINKAIVLINRINRYFGYNWEAEPSHMNGDEKSNVTITCIDTAKGRLSIGYLLAKEQRDPDDLKKKYYWLDLGNSAKTGQVVLGTLTNIDQPKSTIHTNVGSLKTVIKTFPELKKIKEKDQGPSCSLAEALKKQDLFINSTLAQFGCNLIWKLFREGMISYHGCYVNLESFVVNPIKIT
jgi:PRTRC genetic system ThiF family protein